MKRCRRILGHIWQRQAWLGHAWTRFGWLLPTLSISAIFLVAGVVLSHWKAASGQSAPGMPTVIPGYANADQSMIQGLRQALDSSRLNSAERQALQKKLAYTERLATQRAARPEARGPKGRLVPPVPMPQAEVISSAEPAERIIPGSEGLVHPWEASINNLWEGSYNNVPYQVLAGSSADDPTQGLVILIDYSAGRPAQQTYRAPAHSGALQIVARQGGRLQCVAKGGAALFFDMESRTFQEQP